jgi:hypothetical protein
MFRGAELGTRACRMHCQLSWLEGIRVGKALHEVLIWHSSLTPELSGRTRAQRMTVPLERVVGKLVQKCVRRSLVALPPMADFRIAIALKRSDERSHVLHDRFELLDYFSLSLQHALDRLRLELELPDDVGLVAS